MAKEKEGNNEINFRIAEIFYEMADILQIQNVKWKPQAFIVAGQTLESLNDNISEIYKKNGKKGLLELPGIGEALAEKIIQFIKTGKIREHERLKKTIPRGLYEMMRVPGIGAKKAALFYNKLGIKNVDELSRAAEEHKIAGLPGFKERSEQKIIEGIDLMKQDQTRIPWKKAEKIVNSLLKEIKKIPEVAECLAAGSFRRRKSSVRDLDIIVRTDKPEKMLGKFVKLRFVKQVLGIGEEKATIITRDGIQVDMRVFTDEEFGAGLLYFTGDKQHNIWLRKIAIKKGWKLNEYGLFDKNGLRIAGKTEQEIYDKLGLNFISPEKRIGEVN